MTQAADRHRRRNWLRLAGALLTLPAAAWAGSPAPLPAAAHAALAAFRAAAATPGGEALANLAALPFRYDGRALDRAAFMAEVVPTLFTLPVRRCLQQAPALAEDGMLVLWCGPYGFYLGATPAGWRLVEFAADPE